MIRPRDEASDALAALHDRHYVRLVRLAVALVDHEGAAEEVVQDVFVRLLRNWSTLRDVSDIEAYLRRAVVNAARDRLRRRRVRRALPVLHLRPAAGPEDTVLLREEHRQVLAALRQLPPRQREVLVLRHFGSLSEAETAATLDITVSAVKSAAHKGTLALRAKLSATLEIS